jgi:diguanylate cyclase (GGDEF)-like protein/PAS domain S-box-containing protein
MARSQQLFKLYLGVVVAFGAVVVLSTGYHLSVAHLDWRWLLLSLVTVVIGSRVSIKIPSIKSEITVADTFIFLTMLLYDGEAAILLAGLEAVVSSLHFTKKVRAILFNASVMLCSTFLTVSALRFCFGSIVELPHNDTSTFIMAVCLMALAQYVVNSGLVATYTALKTEQPVWQTWRKHFLWTSITYFAGALTASIVTYLQSTVGFRAIIAITPIIAIVYFTYRTYLKTVEALQESEERFRNAFDYAAVGMALVSPEGRWLQVNRSLCGILGYTEEELLATNFQTLTHPEDLDAAAVSVSEVMEGKLPSCQLEKRYLHKLGHSVWVLLSASQIRDKQAKEGRLIFQIQDVTDRKRAEQQLLYDAFHDALTGLANRALFTDHLKLAIARAQRQADRQFAVLFLDLDRFKVINDSLGHMVGDQLLVGIARRLESCLRPGDTVARLGGDEFTILLEDLHSEAEVVEVAERLKQTLAMPFNLGGHQVFTTASIGITLSSIGYSRPEDCLRDADTAMYRAKQHGKARHELFDASMHARAMKLLQVESDLRRAVEHHELVVYYQPIMSLETGRIRGFEALVRWQHPQQGLISPVDFIPVAEETGLIVPLGQWVLGEACRQARVWQELFPSDPPLTISVNISAKQFAQPDLVGQVEHVLRETGLAPGSLHLELTESVVMENIETATDLLHRLRALGVALSIDDFGTGYSSLNYLHNFPLDTLKIDRSFVSQMAGNNENTEIVQTIVTLARSLGMNVVAEGIETKMQLASLRALECEGGQGYLFAKPMPTEAAEAFLFDMFIPQVAASSFDSFTQLQPVLAG